MSLTCTHCHQPIAQPQGIVLDENRHTIRAGDRAVRLTRSQFEFFMVLFRRFGRVVRKDAIYDQLFQLRREDDMPGIKIVDVYACKVRMSLKAAALPVAVRTYWGVGYVLDYVAPAAPESPRA